MIPYTLQPPEELEWMQRIAPDIKRTAIQIPSDTMGIFEMAERYECSRVQFWNGMFDEALIEKMHNHNIICNHFYADTKEDFEKYFDMGIDTLLTNRMDLAAEYKKSSKWF